MAGRKKFCDLAARNGRDAKAKAAYNDFLTLWQNADPEIPF